MATLSGGGILLTEDERDSIHTDELRGFLAFGFHSSRCAYSCAAVNIVHDIYGGQFDLNWCSVACMREGLLRVLDEIEVRLQNAPPGPDGYAPK